MAKTVDTNRLNAKAIPGWCHGGIAYTPITKCGAFAVVKTGNTAENVKAVTETFTHETDYGQITNYQSLSQQHIASIGGGGGAPPAGYSVHGTSSERPSVGSGLPYPKARQLKAYKATNPVLTADIPDNTKLSNLPQAFSLTNQFLYTS
jgi:hypothetical protein